MELFKMLTSINDTWEDKANSVLSNFNFRYPDEIDMGYICWRYGIKLLPTEESSYSIPSEGRKGIIFVQHDLDHINKRIVIAEEFCHLYNHYSNQLGKKDYEINKDEKQAKKMAAYLLMPKQFLDHIYNAAFDQAVMISEIADYFLVTEEFAQFRLELIHKRKIDAIIRFGDKLGTIEWFE
ncbi:ImmA/IrrE family metallo-endopeptidase [Novibacillus thermophilus]|uniref:IrrE N-terminal-like domain-containing protein n=1 Tax=Novibacillus thermophilus TaxID=1471761 RepID=A0A1U9K5D8_9BACL|nr:ImmA/IrrE family metallo-endopeptidase [Novibacillus thermophilus]AQS55265.1 hypothetical protein B0W44_05200 [Novibacillus thermophilus]